jgi:tetratricopeptide (TPR) repeat protein
MPAASARRPQEITPPAAFLLVSLSAILAWWASKEGGYFGTVLLPGIVILCAVAGILLVMLPPRGTRLAPTVAGALAALVGLGLWTLLSSVWTPAPDAALADAQRVLGYALLFGLFLCLARLLGPRSALALVPLAFAAAFAGTVAVVDLLTSNAPSDVLEIDGTLDTPLGYRNANAAFFAIALFPALGLAADPERDWRLRAGALGTATLAIEMAMLSQSRASIPAAAVALLVFVLVAPARLRALCWLGLAVVPALAVIPPLTDLYRVGADEGGLSTIIDEMRAAGRAAALSTLAAVAIAALPARFEGRVSGFSSPGGRSDRAVLAVLAVLAVAGAVSFVVVVGNPIDWIGKRATELKAGEADLSERSSRFTLNAGSNRPDFWRVAIDQVRDNPLLGDGAGGFEYAYSKNREKLKQNARDAHSVELEILGELGVPGLLLFISAIGCAMAGALASRRRGPPAALLSTVALASGTYWLVHASVDWFWSYPAVTASALALLGSACAAAGFKPGPPRWRRWRIAAVAALAILALSAIPPFLSERYVDHAYAVWRADLDRAYDDLSRAEALNPLSDLPPLAEGAIARAAGDRARAIDAFTNAAEQRPEEWAAHYLLAELQQRSDPALARREIAIALEQNPLNQRVRSLARRLGIEVPPRPS